MDWPDGRRGPMRLIGRARDATTPLAGGPPKTLALDEFHALLTPDRTITEITASPPRPAIAGLVGARAGGQLRRMIVAALPDEVRDATPLYLILDDVAGASLVAAWAWSRHMPEWHKAITNPPRGTVFPNMENVCTGFRTGSAALLPGGAPALQNFALVDDLRHPDDPDGWHAFTAQTGVGMRRARRIDIWRAGGLIAIDAAFQDSANDPSGGRATVHEYQISATADATSLRLLSVVATPRVLPYAECPAAALNAPRMIGVRLPEFRTRVVETLPGTAGCTHLNDALRALAEVPALAGRLPVEGKADVD